MGSKLRVTAFHTNASHAAACTVSAFQEVLYAVQVQFACEGVTISGIELEVQTGTAGKPIAKLTRRFQAGDYKV